jgi:DNA-directed RNA polymerase subunit N (RpoN/RPB10)
VWLSGTQCAAMARIPLVHLQRFLTQPAVKTLDTVGQRFCCTAMLVQYCTRTKNCCVRVTLGHLCAQLWPWEDATLDEMELAYRRMRAMFEFLDKLGVDYWCFHDRQGLRTALCWSDTTLN